MKELQDAGAIPPTGGEPPRPEYGPLGAFTRGTAGGGDNHWAHNRLAGLWSNSALNPSGYGRVLQNEKYGIGAKAAYVGGRVTADLLGDGTRVPWWVLNHELARWGMAGDMAAQAAGLAPDYDAERKLALKNNARAEVTKDAVDEAWARRLGFSHNEDVRGLPSAVARSALPLLGTMAVIQSSGNHDLLNIAGGGRVAGFQPVLPSQEDPSRTGNPIGELASRYLFGRTGRVLPWEQFSAERPDVSPEDYKAYAGYQFDGGPFDLGLIRATSRNIDGEPEYQMLGFRTPLSSLGTGAGALAGGIAGSQLAQQGLKEPLRRAGLKREGHRRLAGAFGGAIAGAIAGNVGTKAVNAAVIQPLLNPERVALAEAWRAQQEALGLL